MFGMQIGFSLIGTIIFVLPMLINIVYFTRIKDKAIESIEVPFQYTELIEKVFRVLYAVFICLLTSHRIPEFNSIFLFPTLVFLLFYYAVWIRYFYKGMAASDLYNDFLKVPIPLAIFPVIYYFFGALFIHNVLAAGTIVIFGWAHFKVSLDAKKKLIS